MTAMRQAVLQQVLRASTQSGSVKNPSCWHPRGLESAEQCLSFPCRGRLGPVHLRPSLHSKISVFRGPYRTACGCAGAAVASSAPLPHYKLHRVLTKEDDYGNLCRAGEVH